MSNPPQSGKDSDAVSRVLSFLRYIVASRKPASTSNGDVTFGLFEPAGGTAPDIAGQNLANPIAQIFSAALMLRYSFGLTAAAAAVEDAVVKAIAAGFRTGDIFSPTEPAAKRVGTSEMGDVIAAGV